eukprot:TRINITY_DN14431_c0_g1_i1.p1 TRINITY_DN14431_c0_g1~~TRINITY_DN14431_c0_g1_i1.p1  ORF type:complete len:419 (+),score=102.90 TRINITY_DN14431_c0_g1_i1:508-1764(+)
MWPALKVGHVRVADGVRDRRVTLTTLSLAPRVFGVSNFASDEELDELVRTNEDRLEPSQVGSYQTRKRSLIRTSSTHFDHTSPASVALQRRAFQLLGMGWRQELAEGVQVLRYRPGETYNPHCDWFERADLTDNRPDESRTATNRYATLLLYMSNVEGGYTVFPLAESVLGGERRDVSHAVRLAEAGGYPRAPALSQEEIAWACAEDSASLKVAPHRGRAVLFYNQRPNGSLATESLHGACPVHGGVKWSANVWVWNRPWSAAVARSLPGQQQQEERDGVELVPAGGPRRDITVRNGLGAHAELWWVKDEDPPVWEIMNLLGPDEELVLHSFVGHRFVASPVRLRPSAQRSPMTSGFPSVWATVRVSSAREDQVLWLRAAGPLPGPDSPVAASAEGGGEGGADEDGWEPERAGECGEI